MSTPLFNPPAPLDQDAREPRARYLSASIALAENAGLPATMALDRAHATPWERLQVEAAIEGKPVTRFAQMVLDGLRRYR